MRFTNLCYNCCMKKIAIALILIFVFSGVGFARDNSTTSASVKYDLPYPGMLPDHKLYKLKVLRDKVMLFIIQDPIKKAEQHLLLADKRILMAKILADKGNVELAKETALKGENEITLLVFLFKDERRKPTKELFNRVEKASFKHQEVLNDIAKKVEKKYKKTFETVVYFSTVNLGELRKIYKDY